MKANNDGTSKQSVIENIILETLADGQIHTVEEIKNKVGEYDATILESYNLINVVLSSLKTKKKLIKSEGRALYSLVTEEDREVENDENMKLQSKLLECWRECYRKIVGTTEPSFDMTAQEFIEAKKLYKLNQEVEKVIKKNIF